LVATSHVSCFPTKSFRRFNIENQVSGDTLITNIVVNVTGDTVKCWV
jgi:hypothetical protein